MSKPVLYLFNGKVARFGNAVFGFTPQIYTVTLDTVTHGSITASPMSGIAGTTIELSNTPDTGYELDYFTVNGVAIVGNSFTMPEMNVTVGAVFVEESPTFDEVTIGTQTWMAKNLAIEDGGEGISTSTRNYGQGDVVETYYTFDAAVRVAASVTGWHLPSQEEYETLISYVGGTSNGKKLMSTYGWQYGSGSGTDDYGFAAFPANSANSTTRNQADFWTTTSDPSETNYFYVCRLSPYSGGTVVVDRSIYKSNRITVRLIKDS